MTQDETLTRAQELIGYTFKDESLLKLALTHASLADHRLESNERLEFLGDAVLGLVVCEELFRIFPDELEGELTKLKSSVVSRRTCAEISDRIQLTPLIFLGKGMDGRGHVPVSLRAAVFESIIGAVFIDGGFDDAKKFIIEHVSDHIEEAAESEHQHNFKSLLQQHAQRNLSATPYYEQLDEKGPDHSKCFEICVTIGVRRFKSAWGNSKKEAEQKAAFNAMQEINHSDFDVASLCLDLEPVLAPPTTRKNSRKKS